MIQFMRPLTSGHMSHWIHLMSLLDPCASEAPDTGQIWISDFEALLLFIYLFIFSI